MPVGVWLLTHKDVDMLGISTNADIEKYIPKKINSAFSKATISNSLSVTFISEIFSITLLPNFHRILNIINVTTILNVIIKAGQKKLTSKLLDCLFIAMNVPAAVGIAMIVNTTEYIANNLKAIADSILVFMFFPYNALLSDNLKWHVFANAKKVTF